MEIGSSINTPEGVGNVTRIVPNSVTLNGQSFGQAEVSVDSSSPADPLARQDILDLSNPARQLLEQQPTPAAPLIGSVLNTPQGPATVDSVLPDRSGAVTTPLTSQAQDPILAQPTANPAVAGSVQTNRLELQNTPRTSAELSEDEKEAVRELQAIDRAVRAEEQTHSAVAGAYGSAPQYSYVTGPDGRQYAVGGSVSVDTSSAVTPEQAERAAGAVAAAAMSVNTPSSADFQAAAQANGAQQESRQSINSADATASPSTNAAIASDQQISPVEQGLQPVETGSLVAPSSVGVSATTQNTSNPQEEASIGMPQPDPAFDPSEMAREEATANYQRLQSGFGNMSGLRML